MAQSQMQSILPANRKDGLTYLAILHLAKHGTIPASVEEYNSCRATMGADFGKKFGLSMPSASNLHGAHPPDGMTFREENSELGLRYQGFHVMNFSGLTVFFELPELLKDENGHMTDVWDSKDRIVLTRLGFREGKPAIDFEYKKSDGVLVVRPDPEQSVCVPFIKEDGYYELQGNLWVKAENGKTPPSDPKVNYVQRSSPETGWMGIFGLGGLFDKSDVTANTSPSDPMGLLLMALDSAKDGLQKQVAQLLSQLELAA